MLKYNITNLPNELLSIIFEDLDILSKIYVKATCKTFQDLSKVKYLRKFTLHDDDKTHIFQSLNEFQDHIYDSLISSDSDTKSYHLIRNPDITMIFHKQRIKNMYVYKVTIENLNNILTIAYQNRRIECIKNSNISIPKIFFVLGLRMLKKIYKYKSITYNFDNIPPILLKMTNKSYNGQLFREIICEDITF
jgi:hypothetical protein